MVNTHYNHLSPHDRFIYIAETETKLKGFKHSFARNCIGNIILNIFCCFSCRRKSDLEQRWEDHRIYLMTPPSYDNPEYSSWVRAARRVNEMVPYFQRIEITPRPVIRNVYVSRSVPVYVPPRREVVVVSDPIVPPVVFVPRSPPPPPVIVVTPPPPPVIVIPPRHPHHRPRCPHPPHVKPRSNPQVIVNTSPDFRGTRVIKPTSHNHGRIQNLPRVNQAVARQLKH